MQTLVIYDSKFGNTELIAQAIARGIGTASEVLVMSTPEAAEFARTAAGAPGHEPTLLIVGGPTHKRNASAPLKAFLDTLPAAYRGIPAASFDTRYRGPLLIMGSAAAATAKALASAGSQLVAPPESFFMVRGGSLPLQTLEPGEITR